MAGPTVNRVEEIFDPIPIAISLMNGPETKFGNSAFLKMFGLSSQEELRSLPELALVAPECRALLAESIEKRARGFPVPTTFEIECLRHDGSRFPVLLQLALPSGDEQGIITFLTDLTEPRRVEQAVQDSEARFRALVQNSTDLIFVIDDGGRLVYGSPSGDRVLGYSAEALVGSRLIDLVHTEDAGRVAHELASALSTTGVTPPVAFRVRHADGGWRWLEAVGNNLMDAREIGGLVVNARDITDQHQARLDLEQANRLLWTMVAADAALVHSTDEAELFQEVCRVIVETGGYPAAVIAVPDPGGNDGILFAGAHGADPAFIAACLSLSRDDAILDPIMNAARQNKFALVRDTELLPVEDTGRRLALQFGYRSALAIPLRGEASLIAGLGVFAESPDGFTDDAVSLFQQLAEDLGYGISSLRSRAARERHLERVGETLRSLVATVAAIVELRDPYTAGHQRRVALLATAIAEDLGLDDETIAGIDTAAGIHDIGKIAVPAEILSKPGRLSAVEYELVKQHAWMGYELLKEIDFPWPVADMVLQHHERLDGSGYPSHLRAGEILVGSRVIAVADTVEAISSHRPYRPGLGLNVAFQELESGSATRYDEAVVASCLRLFNEGRFTWDQT